MDAGQVFQDGASEESRGPPFVDDLGAATLGILGASSVARITSWFRRFEVVAVIYVLLICTVVLVIIDF